MANVQILLFMPSSSLTGGPRVLLNLLDQLDQTRFDPLVFLLEEGPLVNELREMGVRFRVLPLEFAVRLDSLREADWAGRLAILRACYGYNMKLLGLMKEAGVDLVWARNLKGVLLVGLGAMRLGKPLIWDVGLEKPGRGLFRGLNALGLFMATWVVTEARRQPAQIFGERLVNRFSRKIRTIDPGISDQRIAEIHAAAAARCMKILKRRAKLNVLQVGTICPRKNQLLSVKAVERLKSHSICLHLVGAPHDEAYQQLLESYVAEHELQEMVVFYGWSDRIPEFLAAADLLLMTSLNEGIPYAVHEAMHARLPVVVSDAGGMADAVIPGVTGKITRSENLCDLVEALHDFVEHPELLAAMGEAGQQHVVEKFSAKSWYEQYQCLFAESLVR